VWDVLVDFLPTHTHRVTGFKQQNQGVEQLQQI